jgi:hypothetical protein
VSNEATTAAPSTTVSNSATTRVAFGSTALVFASRVEAQALQVAQDPFRRGLTPVDRQLLALSATAVAPDEIDAKLAALAQEWTVDEIRQQTAFALEALRLMDDAGLSLRLPPVVNLVKNDQRVYSGSPYTRGTTVFTPRPLDPSTLVHELWHVESRANHAKLAPIYAMVGYTPCVASLGSADSELLNIAITNPDTEAFGDYCVTLHDATGKPTRYTPLVVAKDSFDGSPEGFGAILDVTLLAVDPTTHATAKSDGKTVRRPMFDPATFAEYAKAIGGNGLAEPFHPDEIIASSLGSKIRITGGRPDPESITNPQLLDQLVAAVSKF